MDLLNIKTPSLLKEEDIIPLIIEDNNNIIFTESNKKSTTDFLLVNYRKPLQDMFGYYNLKNNIKANIKKCLIIALQVELKKKGAKLIEINGIFEGNTKTAYALYAKIITKNTNDKIVTIWKYILIENGYTLSNVNSIFDEECFEKTKQYQQSIKTNPSGIVGFNLLDIALK